MPKFIVVRGNTAVLSVRDEIAFVFDAESVDTARRKMLAYLTDFGLPCEGPIDDRFTLYSLTPVPSCAFTGQAFWDLHVRSKVGVSEF